MNKILIIFSLVLLAACGPSQEEKKNIVLNACSIMGETQKSDSLFRIQTIIDAREKIGGETFVRGDDAIIEAIEFGLCQELVLNETYDETLQPLKDAKRERERIAAEKLAEEQRIAAEKLAEEKRIAAEKQRIADSKPTVKEEFYSSGKLKGRASYQPKSDGGKLHGPYEKFYENGQLGAKENYKDGKLDGLVESYQENGQLGMKNNWKDGELDGLFEVYTPNGQLTFKVCYKNGEETDMPYCE